MSKKTTVPSNEVMTRRAAMGALAVGAGALLFSSAAEAQSADEASAGHWISWDDGWSYPITGLDENGLWSVAFPEGELFVDPSGHIFDSGVWYPIAEVDSSGIWYDGNDGQVYLLSIEGVSGSGDTLV